MQTSELLLLNAAEVRRRSLKVWRGIPADRLSWRPDPDAMSCQEMVRHVLEGEYLYMLMIRARRNVPQDDTPFSRRAYTTVEDEIEFARPYRAEFESLVSSIPAADLTTVTIERPDAGYKRQLGDFLLRVAYHEAVHCGQLLGYLRTMGADRPRIWD
jgi:uncharacterized damage-inducible protein DinB